MNAHVPSDQHASVQPESELACDFRAELLSILAADDPNKVWFPPPRLTHWGTQYGGICECESCLRRRAQERKKAA